VPKSKPPYPEEFRREAVELHCLSGKSLKQVADDLGISDMTLRNWIKQAEIDKGKREIFSGIFGTLTPGLNFGTAITWYVWFFVIFLMMVAVGRAWCAMCPFGGFAEWLQRRTLWQRTTKTLGLGWRLPESWAGHGLLISTVVFVGLTWIEEYFNIAGPGVARRCAAATPQALHLRTENYAAPSRRKPRWRGIAAAISSGGSDMGLAQERLRAS
jgi:hypothetical protein